MGYALCVRVCRKYCRRERYVRYYRGIRYFKEEAAGVHKLANGKRYALSHVLFSMRYEESNRSTRSVKSRLREQFTERSCERLTGRWIMKREWRRPTSTGDRIYFESNERCNAAWIMQYQFRSSDKYQIFITSCLWLFINRCVIHRESLTIISE